MNQQQRITITVSKTIYDNLKELKQEKNAKTWGKLIFILLGHYRSTKIDPNAPEAPLLEPDSACKIPIGNLLKNDMESLILEVS